MTVDQQVLEQRWLHSHEEDAGGARVYRPSSYKFPRSRGRGGLELRPDGTVVQVDVGAVDAPVNRPGTWSLDGDTLVIEVPGQATRRLHISSLDRDRMVVDGTP
jgi:hypothetical protein